MLWSLFGELRKRNVVVVSARFVTRNETIRTIPVVMEDRIRIWDDMRGLKKKKKTIIINKNKNKSRQKRIYVYIYICFNECYVLWRQQPLWCTKNNKNSNLIALAKCCEFRLFFFFNVIIIVKKLSSCVKNHRYAYSNIIIYYHIQRPKKSKKCCFFFFVVVVYFLEKMKTKVNRLEQF